MAFSFQNIEPNLPRHFFMFKTMYWYQFYAPKSGNLLFLVTKCIEN